MTEEKRWGSIKVSIGLRDALNEVKGADSVNNYLIKNLVVDSVKNPGVEKSLLLAALDVMRDRIADERFYDPPSENSLRMQDYYNLRREQHAQDMKDSLAKSNRDTEKRLYGNDKG